MTETAHDWDVVQEEDRYSTGRILGITAGVLLVIAASLVVVTLMLEDVFGDAQVRVPVETFPAAEAPREIGGVEQTRIGEDYGARLLAGQRRALESFGWVDEGRGIVRIPIDRAMRLVAEGER